MHNENQNMSIGLYALSFSKSDNIIKIEKDCQITINNDAISIKKGQYTKEQLNKLISPLVIYFIDKKVKIESSCYYNLDENLKKYLGFKDIEFIRKSNKIMIYYPTPDEKYINIEKECEFRLGRNGQIPLGTIFIGVYSISEIENLFNSFGAEFVANFPKISLEINKNVLKITTSVGLCFDEYLSNCLGFDYIGDFIKNMIPINKTWPRGKEIEKGIVYKPPDIVYTVIGLKTPTFYTQSFLKDINGVIETNNNKTVINKQNYTIDQLNKLLPSNIKIQQTNNYITITSKEYYLMDENLRFSLGFDDNYVYKHIGSDIILVNYFENIFLEVHCDIIEKSISNHKIEQYLHADDDILCVIKCDSGGQYISNDIKYTPLNVIDFKSIKLFITDQDGNEIICNEFVAYLILKTL